MDVLEHEQDRTFERGQEVEHELQHAPRAAAARRLVGQHGGQRAAGLGGETVEPGGEPVGGEVAQRRDDRRVRQVLAPELDALAVQDQ